MEPVFTLYRATKSTECSRSVRSVSRSTRESSRKRTWTAPACARFIWMASVKLQNLSSHGFALAGQRRMAPRRGAEPQTAFSSRAGFNCSLLFPVEVSVRLSLLFDRGVDSARQLQAHRRPSRGARCCRTRAFSNFFAEATSAMLRVQREALLCSSNVALCHWSRH